MTETNDTGKLWDMIKSIEIAMMVTEDGDQLRSRPMAVSQKDFDGTLWFFTHTSAHKVAEIDSDHRVNLAYASPSKQNYVSVSGMASLVRDKSQIAAHWTEAMKVWFPKGQDDPDVALLKVVVHQAEYWDAPSSTMLHAYGYIKQALTGKSPEPGGHGTVKLK